MTTESKTLVEALDATFGHHVEFEKAGGKANFQLCHLQRAFEQGWHTHDSAQQEKLKEVRSGLAEAVGIYETDGDSDQRIRKMHDEVVLALSILDGMITGQR